MSSMRDLLEKITFAGQAVGQKPGDQVRGSEPMPKKGGGKKHPYAGRLVGGGTESVEEDTEKQLREEYERWLAEYGAPGTAVGPGNDEADPVEIAALRRQADGEKQNVRSQVLGKTQELQGVRKQLSDLNRTIPAPNAPPLEKTQALVGLRAQKNALQAQIRGVSSELAQMKQML